MLIALYSRGNLQDALTPGNQSAHQFRDDHNILNILRAIYARLGGCEESIITYNEAVQLNSNSAEAYYNLGNALNGFGKIKNRLPDIVKQLSLNLAMLKHIKSWNYV
jgi:tetratricopeptide (TPR) repeat protein